MSTDDRMETITDPALIRATDDPDERGDFPCCADRAHKESLGGDSESGTYNRSNRPPAGPCTDADNPWALLPDDHPQRPKQCGGCGTKWVDAETARACERRHGDDITIPAPVGAAVALDLDAIEAAALANDGWWSVPAFALVAEVRRLAALCIPLTDLAQELDLSRQNLHHSRAMSSAHFERAEREKARAESAEAEVVTLRANWRHVTKSLGYGDGVTEPQIGHVEFVAECERQFSEASEWRESQRWRDECHDAGHPDDEDCYEHDPALVLLTLRAKVAAVEALVNNGQTVGWIERDGDAAWIAADAIRAALATTGEGE